MLTPEFREKLMGNGYKMRDAMKGTEVRESYWNFNPIQLT